MKPRKELRVFLILVLFAALVLTEPAWKFLSGTTSSKIRHLEIGIPHGHYVAAIGDFNCDRFDDFFVISQDQQSCTVYIFDSVSSPAIFKSSNASIHINTGKILNVIPSDFNQDGKLDLLLTIEISKGFFENTIYYGDRSTFSPIPRSLPVSSSEVSILDFHGTMQVDVFGTFEWNGQFLPLIYSPSLNKSIPLTWPKDKKPCTSLGRSPSSAFVDVNGDSMSDLVFVCEAYDAAAGASVSAPTDHATLEIFVNGPKGLSYDKSVSLSPKPASPLSFCDMDGDGSLDIVYASETGLHILYNTQKPYCVSGKEEESCKGRDNLFDVDKNYGYLSNSSTESMYQLNMPFSSLFASVGSNLHLKTQDPLGGPVPLRFGDFDLDGYPDLMIIDSKGTLRLLNNSICTLGEQDSPCSMAHVESRRRYFKLDESVTKLLSDIWDTMAVAQVPWSASFINLAHNGMTGLLLNSIEQSTGKYKPEAVLSAYYHDAFFIDLITTNGVCHSDCRFGERFPKPKPYGVSYPGPCYKYSLVDMNGSRRIRQACQYGQTGHMGLSLPGLFLGLGRINTFVEALAIRTPSRTNENRSYHNNIIPNSNLIAFPPSNSSAELEWFIELHISPSDYILWILVSLASSMVLLASIVFIFRRMEKLEDAKEKRKTLHAINFDAL